MTGSGMMAVEDGNVPDRLYDVEPKWLWVTCSDPFCGHARAVPLVPWRIRWGVQDAQRLIRQRFRCGVCGRLGVDMTSPRPTWAGLPGTRHFDPEYFPDNPVRMSGHRLVGESYQARDERVLAAYLKRFPSGDALGEFRGDAKSRTA